MPAGRTECVRLEVQKPEVQRRMITHPADGIWKGFLEKLPCEKDGQNGGDGISCRANGMSKAEMENVSYVGGIAGGIV